MAIGAEFARPNRRYFYLFNGTIGQSTCQVAAPDHYDTIEVPEFGHRDVLKFRVTLM